MGTIVTGQDYIPSAWLPPPVRLCSPLFPMDPYAVAHIVCSALSLACICVQLFFLMRSAIRLEQAARSRSKGSKGMDQLRSPAHLLRAKQALPIITAISGLAYCGCSLVLRSEGSPDTDYAIRIVLTCAVLFTEGTVFAELAHLSWPKYSTRVMGLILCGITTCGISSITLRVLGRKSNVREPCHCSTSSRHLIDSIDSGHASPLGAAISLVCCWRVPSDNTDPCGMEQRTHRHQERVYSCSHGQPPIQPAPLLVVGGLFESTNGHAYVAACPNSGGDP